MGVFMESMRHVMLDAAVDDATYLSLHDDDPGTDGSNELSGGSPAYARQQGTFSAASAGKRVLSSDVTFDVPTGTVAWVGLWTASSGGTFRGKHQVTSEVFGAQGNYVVEATNTYFSVQDP